ncbi:MAG: SDR family NAD(P)-dependent oxidoreductase [Proteobacteria bacterium]|nr:MAG: SDR family NAD(P)-dependent oxidoreductase [Pseudomonadota bacterium]
MSITWNFQGRSAIVSGAGGGIGLAIARRLLDSGARVLLVDIKPRPMELPEIAEYAVLDLTDADAVDEACRDFRDRHGRLDYLVNAAGVLWFERDCSVTEIDLDVWDRVMTVNLKSMVHTARAVIPLMKPRGGAMVHFSSIQCLRGDDRPQDAYQASKAGVLALSKSIAVQFACNGIRSNALLPGPTRSPMQARWEKLGDADDKVAAGIPLGRVGEPGDHADACLFLLSDEASWITGAELIVDGGITALP